MTERLAEQTSEKHHRPPAQPPPLAGQSWTHYRSDWPIIPSLCCKLGDDDAAAAAADDGGDKWVKIPVQVKTDINTEQYTFLAYEVKVFKKHATFVLKMSWDKQMAGDGSDIGKLTNEVDLFHFCNNYYNKLLSCCRDSSRYLLVISKSCVCGAMCRYTRLADNQ